MVVPTRSAQTCWPDRPGQLLGSVCPGPWALPTVWPAWPAGLAGLAKQAGRAFVYPIITCMSLTICVLLLRNEETPAQDALMKLFCDPK